MNLWLLLSLLLLQKIKKESVTKIFRFPSLNRAQREEPTQSYKKKYPKESSSCIVLYNIVDKLKRIPSRASPFDALHIPRQIDLLKATLLIQNEEEEDDDCNCSLNIVAKLPSMGKNRPPPFYITLELEGHIVHKCIIDSRLAMIVMPKKLSNIIRFTYTRDPLKFFS